MIATECCLDVLLTLFRSFYIHFITILNVENKRFGFSRKMKEVINIQNNTRNNIKCKYEWQVYWLFPKKVVIRLAPTRTKMVT